MAIDSTEDRTQDHKEKLAKYGKEYYQNHKEDLKQRQKEYYQDHKEEARIYYQIHKEEARIYYQIHKEDLRQYYKDHQVELRQWSKEHYQAHREEVLKRAKKYNQTDKGKEKHNRSNAKRQRELGFNPLNEPFPGSVWHHINDQDVVAIPKEVHVKFGGYRRIRHRLLIFEYYGSLKNMINFQQQIVAISTSL